MRVKWILILLGFLAACGKRNASPAREASAQSPEFAVSKAEPQVEKALKAELQKGKELSPDLHNHKELRAGLRKQKELIDTLLSQKSKSEELLIFVKVPGKSSLIAVRNEQWPEEVETTYNVLKDEAGKIILISEIPFSESGDWDITYSHYFDQKGNTFAYVRRVAAFNTFCPDDKPFGEVTVETAVNLYAPGLALIDSTYKMVGDKAKDITKRKCQQEVNSDHLVFKNLADFTTGKVAFR